MDLKGNTITAFALCIIYSCLQVGEADSHGSQTVSYEYGVILDGGSTGTKLKVYRWKQVTASFVGSVLDVEQIESIKFEPGISEYAARLDELPNYLFDITNKAEELVPTNQQWRTPIYLMATAGLRVLSGSDAMSLLGQIEKLLSYTSFLTLEDHVRVLSGEEEGVFAWVAANYLKGFFWTDKPASKSVGVLEMGGGSTQIAFLPEVPVYANMFPVRLGGETYNLYAHSYLFYGQNYIISRINNYLVDQSGGSSQMENPCMLRDDASNFTTTVGTTIEVAGTGNYSECQTILDIFLKTAEDSWCYPKPCAIGRTYQPGVDNFIFYAISTFVYTPTYLKALDDKNRLDISLLKQNAQEHCGKTLNEAIADGIPAKYASGYCTMGLYIPALLVDAYGFDINSQDVIVTSKMNDVDIDWSLGAMLVQLDNNLEKITEQKTHTSGDTKLNVEQKLIVFLSTAITFVLHCKYTT